jgi:hypothetical protein
MKWKHLSTTDLIHHAKHGITEDVALWAVKEFITRPDATITMYYHLLHSSRFESVKRVAETNFLKRRDLSDCDVAWLAVHALSSEVRLTALWQLAERQGVRALQWSKIVRDSNDPIICCRAQEFLAKHPDANQEDLLWLDENGMTEPIKAEVRTRLQGIFP